MAADPTTFGTPLYVESAPDPVFAFFHEPSDKARRTAVLFCPPFGWDDTASYRPRRDWAQALAEAGYPALRFDFPGSGDSGGGPRDPGRLDAWTASVAATSTWLRDRTGAERIVAIGTGLGGVVALRAACDGAPVDDFVLWGVPARGKTLLRELRAFARMEAAGRKEPEGEGPEHLADGGLEAAGYFLSAETFAELEALDLTALDLPDAARRRALLLDREGIDVDARLKEFLEGTGASVQVSPGPGYSAYLEEPQLARPPREAFALVAEWIAQGETANGGEPVAASEPAATRTQLDLPGQQVRETPFTVERPEGSLFGILAEPLAAPRTDVCAVILNPGALRRTGSGRMWVEVARRWAARGVPTLRLDIAGIGDSDGHAERYAATAALYSAELVPQVVATLDALEQRDIGHRFVLMGLCSGAYWALHTALRDERVVAAQLVNIRALIWDAAIDEVRDARKARWALDGSRWRRVLTGKVPLRELLRVARAALLAPITLGRQRFKQRRTANSIEAGFDRLRDRGQRLLFVFGEDEPVLDELNRDGYLDQMGKRWPNASLRRLPGNNHTFRPLGSQRRLHELLDEEIERDAGLSAAPRSTGRARDTAPASSAPPLAPGA